MDAFSMIQEIFTHMQCNFCNRCFKPDDIQLLREEDALYVVNIFCHECNTENGIAMVGIGSEGLPFPVPAEEGGFLAPHPYGDPELTPDELERLADFEPIDGDAVLDAHSFIQNLDSSWMKHIPEELKQPTEVETDTDELQSPDDILIFSEPK